MDLLIARLDSLDRDGFVALLGPLWEHSPWVAARSWAARPFADREALHAAMLSVVRAAPRPDRLALIRAHPDLAGRLARAGTLAARSAAEQAGLGLDRLSDAEFERFDRLNAAYRTRFGFPFIVAVRAHTRDSVLAAFETRLCHAQDEEEATALAEIGRIAWFRLLDLS